MTWGCNASFAKVNCPYCLGTMIDDRDDGETTHMIKCPKRTLVMRFLFLMGMI